MQIVRRGRADKEIGRAADAPGGVQAHGGVALDFQGGVVGEGIGAHRDSDDLVATLPAPWEKTPLPAHGAGNPRVGRLG